MVKFNYSRLKNNVNKIKSNLKPEEINMMKSLEAKGQFKAEHPRMCSSSSSTKIAAAHKRLNLNTYRRAQSAMPRIQPRSMTSQMYGSTGKDTSRESKMPMIELKATSCSKRQIRPKTTGPGEQSFLTDQVITLKVQTPRSKNTNSVLEKITQAQKANKIQAPQVSYSCHDEKAPGSEDGKSNKSVLDAFGPNPYEERRQKLLNFEGKAFCCLGEKKQGFVNEVGRFVESNPKVVEVKPEITQEVINSIDSMAARPGRSKTRASTSAKLRLRDRSLLREFAEVRKTRYLRIHDSLIEYSANTLASDYLRRTLPWRQYKSDSLSFYESTRLTDTNI
ncbi:uncharacterized protein [Watersipora subatra]|uniref:uncharacterized protein n=1 Tax=Watersipora subatra TaxID=2589382 RepID=UPI00355C182C